MVNLIINCTGFPGIGWQSLAYSGNIVLAYAVGLCQRNLALCWPADFSSLFQFRVSIDYMILSLIGKTTN